MEAIYVISTDKYVKRNIYKVCRHIKSNHDYEIYYCKYVRDAEKIETILQENLSTFRTTTKNGNVSPWIKIDLEKLNWIIDTVITEYIKEIELNKLAKHARYYGLMGLSKVFKYEYGRYVKISGSEK
jgi:hypothetical protein